MRRAVKVFILLFLGLQSLPASPDVLVLVHGYLGSASSWETSGVNAILAQNGWQRAGLATPQGILPGSGSNAVNKVYPVELPSLAPIAVQANLLGGMISAISARHPGESLILAGHSAGGVVARMVLVQGRAPKVKRLITIGSPHLGTIRAVQALDATDSSGPFGIIKDFFGGDLYDLVQDSWGVLIDLTPAQPGSLLYWLNAQQHPDIDYISVMRSGPVGIGDEMVPVFSQDMNNVPALAGKSQRFVVAASHELQPADGVGLVNILSRKD
ncbi:hypothetical protein DJ030_08775 [bacterium endosymbiont of Escarpia laminata]|nr:MAG: hypothetical protein DJ031_17460 [bacterium endosymbiont of Escarpia laminata]RLJ19706.1 MAG: hypothetical protein DJ030_08775 [bacterium endosymbiont of Escarpia laminata]